MTFSDSLLARPAVAHWLVLSAPGVNLGPVVARAQELRIKNAKVTPSVCPTVGCGTLIHTIDGKIVNIEGDPRSPHNEGTLREAFCL